MDGDSMMNKFIDKALDAILHPVVTYGLGYVTGVIMAKVLS
jgi:hypothetical protein